MMKKYSPLVLIFCGLFAGCASYEGWSPTVDPYGDSHADHIYADKAECRELALEASGGTASQTGKGALVGGALGSAAGAILGAATGNNVGGSAAIGAAIGGVGGGASQGFSAEDVYKRTFINCMQNRGHHVLNPNPY